LKVSNIAQTRILDAVTIAAVQRKKVNYE
jgi:hypothetical protein